MCGEIGEGELMCGEEECVQRCVDVGDVSGVCVAVGCVDGDVAEDYAKDDVAEGKGGEKWC